MRPSNPSDGITPFHMTCAGSRPIKPAMNASSAVPPSTFAQTVLTGRERNQCSEYMPRNAGNRKAETPNSCSSTSEISAPKTPIQLCAGRPPITLAAVFNDGSSGE